MPGRGFSASSAQRAGSRQRGQSLVEFALVLPVLLLMMLVALDFGRVYLGYVNLQNLARIAANYAAAEHDAWGGTPNATKQAEYRQIVLNDALATNCDLPGEPDTVAAPTFEDRNSDGDGDDLGDLARVRLTCSFALLTPGIAGIVGNPLAVSAEAVFPISAGLGDVSTSEGSGGGDGQGGAPATAFSAEDRDGEAPFTVQFNDESGGTPTSWVWDFGDGNGSSLRDPMHTYATPGVYDVSLLVGNSAGTDSLVKTGYIFVGEPVGEIAFEADKTSGPAPLEVTFRDRSSSSPTAWLWEFGDGESSTLQNPVHTYTAAGTFDVTLTITSAADDDGDGRETLTKAGYITVSDALCTVPDFVKTNWSAAQTTWEGAGFTTTVTKGPGAPTGNFQIKIQSITGNSVVPCSSTIELNK